MTSNCEILVKETVIVTVVTSMLFQCYFVIKPCDFR